MKRILGLDLGVSSIGWALIKEETDATSIVALGSRIVPYKKGESQKFSKGVGESRNSIRTKARTARKGYDRYQLRRKYLVNILKENGMMPSEELKKLPKMQLWELRSKAVNEEISKEELGRLLLWLNQKRGYKSSRSDANLDKKDTEYVMAVNNRFDQIKKVGLTIGQFFYGELKKNEYFRVKENVFPRQAYMEEFDAICSKQKTHLNLTDELIAKIRNEIIYYQRPLKSQKGLVSVCDFEGCWVTKENGKEFFVGPKVAHKSSPLFQLAKIWENINNIKLSTKQGETIKLTTEEKRKVFDYLDNHEKLTVAGLFKILRKNKDDYTVSKQLEKAGIQGNVTKCAIAKILGDNPEYQKLLQLNLNVIETGELCYWYDKKTGEVLGEKTSKQIDAQVEHEPFYQLWHTIYSINDTEACSNALQKGIIIERKDEDGNSRKIRLPIDKATADKLAAIDFGRLGFGNKSVKVIRKILPYLMEGDMYSTAMSYAGYNHSNSMTKEENLNRKLLERLKPIAKNSLRQPIVEKILNQMVGVVNAIIEKYGKPDEIRIELARELKQSKEERNQAYAAMNRRQSENKKIEEELKEHGLRATRKNIIKYRLYHEIREDKTNDKINAICIYCGQPISWTEAMSGTEVDVEHIIPKAKLFDDSQNNKTLAHRLCNSNKDNMTAYDFMKKKSPEEFNAYVDRVNKLYTDKIISKAKRDKLLMSKDQIPKDFIDRQLRESQYIARKAREILQTVCSAVWSTSGTVTAELRHLWGWDDVTMNLQMPKYKELGLTELVEWESDHGKQKHIKEVIKDWTKRDDHRHHAVDALVIACTKQGFIQRFNTLNSSKTREDMQAEIEKRSEQYKEKQSLLEKYIISQCPLSVSEVERAVAKILISFKLGKKVAVTGKRKIGKRGNKKVVQEGIIIPRGALSEESVYGKIKMIEKNKPVEYLFENPSLIFKPYIKELVEQRLAQFDNDANKAFESLEKEPIYLDKAKSIVLKYGTCFKEEYVIKYNVDVNFNKVDKVIDKAVKNILQARLAKFGEKPKDAFRDVQVDGKTLKWYEDEGLSRPIFSVRCTTGLSVGVPVKKDDTGKEIGFVKTGNNHHIAIYTDKEGNRQEHVCTFWHAVERKKYHLPVIITDTDEVWKKVLLAPDGTYPQSFLEQLPKEGLHLHSSMQKNEMFVFGMSEKEVKAAIERGDYRQISEHLFRVKKLSSNEYVFRHHLDTEDDEYQSELKDTTWKKIRSPKNLEGVVKVRVNNIGRIVAVGEY